MTLLHIIKVDGTVDSQEYTGELKYKCPLWNDIRKMLDLDQDDLVEHVSVLWKGKLAHMFVDEIGQLRRPPLMRNERATRIYYNATIRRRGMERLVPIYDDMAEDPFQDVMAEEPGFQIVGPAVLWEGEME